MACQPDPGEEAEPDRFPADIARNLPDVLDPAIEPDGETDTIADLDNAEFRDRVIDFVREVATASPTATCAVPLTTSKPLWVTVWMFHGGKSVGRGSFVGTELCDALKTATERAIAASGPNQGHVAQARFVVELTDRGYEMVEYQGKGVELANGLVPVRVLDRAMVRGRIDDGAAYLLRVTDPERGGVHKYYHAPTDSFEHQLHTIYTASTLYTLLALQAHDKDDSLRPPIDHGAQFLLSMQSVAPGQPSHGAFHYALDLDLQQTEPRFVVGTTSKSIFTLIELHALTDEPEYLGAARLAADWLLTMQRPDGSVRSELRRQPNGSWVVTEKESILYTGQVLSALSRLHAATGDNHYLEAAAHTAGHLAGKVESEGCYLGDDYRAPNPISSSWAILSLFDFARASGDDTLRETAYDCAADLLARQIHDPDDVYRHGRWPASLSSSGAGWLAEVLSELYLDCRDDEPDRRDRLRDAIVLLLRQLMQYTYSPESSFMVKNPAMAEGGVFWTTRDRYVRTDSVCHAMNAYVFMLDPLPDGVLVELPEPPLAERLALGDRSQRRVGSEDEEADDGPGEADEPDVDEEAVE